MKPFLKWAGGKHRLVPRIEPLLIDGSRFIEPFLGSGAVFMGLQKTYPSYLLADINSDLILLYNVVRANGLEFITNCHRQLFSDNHNSAERFYDLRAEFNATDAAVDPIRRAMLFVYLNRHCYNGLCRYSKGGRFNVPYGKQPSPYFPEKEIDAFAQKSLLADFLLADFRTVMADAGAGDVVYCDPPYVPLSLTASFESYAAGGFGPEDHRALARACFDAALRGAHVVLSNHDTPVTRALYHGARFEGVEVTRSISGDGAKRGKAQEILVVFEAGTRPAEAVALAAE